MRVYETGPFACFTDHKGIHDDALCEAIRRADRGLADAGVMAKQTMKAFDDICLTPVEELTADRIREIRLREKTSKAVFARYLNVTTGLVSQWERGEKHPRCASVKLLTLVAKKGLQAVA